MFYVTQNALPVADKLQNTIVLFMEKRIHSGYLTKYYLQYTVHLLAVEPVQNDWKRHFSAHWLLSALNHARPTEFAYLFWASCSALLQSLQNSMKKCL